MCGWGRVSLLGAAMFLATKGLGIVPRGAGSLGPLAQDEGTSRNFVVSGLRGRTFTEVRLCCPAGWHTWFCDLARP